MGARLEFARPSRTPVARNRPRPYPDGPRCTQRYQRPGEKSEAAAARRLREELGIACELTFLYKFRYQAAYGTKLGENELDWVFRAEHTGELQPRPEEVADHRFVELTELERDMDRNPDRYTPWFRLIVREHDLRRRLARKSW